MSRRSTPCGLNSYSFEGGHWSAKNGLTLHPTAVGLYDLHFVFYPREYFPCQDSFIFPKNPILREEPAAKTMSIYRFKGLPFGLSCSPYLAIATGQHAKAE